MARKKAPGKPMQPELPAPILDKSSLPEKLITAHTIVRKAVPDDLPTIEAWLSAGHEQPQASPLLHLATSAS